MLPAYQAEIVDKGRDGATVGALVPGMEAALRSERPDPDYAAILDIYERVADVAKIMFTRPAEATKATVDATRERLRDDVVARYNPNIDPNALSLLNHQLLATSNPIPVSQNGLKGSIFEHWVRAYHNELLEGERPRFEIVSGADNYEVNADGCVEGSRILVECKSVAVHERPDGTRYCDPPSGEVLEQMRRYKAIVEPGSPYTWLDASKTPRTFDKVRYVFACQEAIDAWEPVLIKHLDGLYEVRLGR